ncbi:phage tail tape measure protein, partial [uncultured Rikenella sp.]|uniref:phage tail tape measure protein n=1 Tax=uncultured Rikenella sp. TaxID=368003 RepID=UPI0025E3B3AD
MANNALKMAFILSATDKMSRVIDAAVKKSTDKLSAFERNASKVGRGMVKSGALIMGAGAAVGGAVFSAGKSVADYAGSVKDASESTGVNTEAWQKMTYAAKISGIEQEKLMTWMVKFDKVLTDAAGGSKTAGQIFKDLGISVKDASGKMRAPEAVFEDVAELLANVEDGATKTAAACAFFGKSGAELLPMLNEGRNGLQGLYRTAEETGNVLANETLTAADEFGKSLDAVKLQAQGVMLQLGSALIPVLSEMKDWLSGVIGKVGDWLKANPELTKTIGKVATAAASILLVLGTASVVIGGVTFAIGKFVSMWKGLMTAIKVGRKVVMMFNKTLLTSPVFWIIVGIVALSVVVYKLIKNWDKVSAFFKRLWDGIKKIFAAVWDWIKNMFLNYTPAGLVIKHWDSIKGWFSGLWDGVKNVFRATWDWIKKMFLNYTPQGLVIKHWDSIKGWFSGLWDGVKNVFR